MVTIDVECFYVDCTEPIPCPKHGPENGHPNYAGRPEHIHRVHGPFPPPEPPDRLPFTDCVGVTINWYLEPLDSESTPVVQPSHDHQEDK